MNNIALDFIKRWEGCRLKAYKDIVGVITIGYGHTSTSLKMGDVITQEQAEKLLAADMDKFERGVNLAVNTDITDNQQAALISFSFNLGLGNLKASTLLKKLNNDDIVGASNEFVRWANAGGKPDAGLMKRRLAEKALFLK